MFRALNLIDAVFANDPAVREAWTQYLTTLQNESLGTNLVGLAVREDKRHKLLLEIVKAFGNRGEEPQVNFWRTSDGVEVDIVVETGGKLIPIEVKLSATPRPAMANAILKFREGLPEKAGPGYVIHPGSVHLPLARGVVALPFSEL